MTIDLWETVIRSAGFSVLVAAWIYSGLGMFGAIGRETGRGVGMTDRLAAHTVYAITAIPYFVICAFLWRPLPVVLSDPTRALLLAVGSALGLIGAAFYLAGRRKLGSMYNVSSSLGSELFVNHSLVTTGPYALCRHPMYFGLFLAASGGLMVYRTWTLVFMALTLVGAGIKARNEEKLLAEEFGPIWERYASEVPPFVPRLTRHNKEVSHVDAATRG